MRARSALLLPALGLLAAAPAHGAVPPPVERIAPGVTAGGIDVGGLSVLQAAQKLKAEATPRLRAEPIVFGVAGRPWKLSGATAGLEVKAIETAQAALVAPAPAEPAGGGVPATIDVPLVITHSRAAVRTFVDAVASRVRHAPRNATLRITLRKMVVRRAKHGLGLDTAAARRLVDAALDRPGRSRTLHKALTRLSPAVSVAGLRRAYGTVVTVDKAHFRLRVFKHLRFSKSYGVAVGQPAYPTPSGLFSVQSKQVNPTWSVPNSPWAGELQGTTVSGGSAANPLKARWMGIVNGVGIHGTGEDYSIGSRASHGCIRMHVSDVVDLYPRVPVGTRVLIR